MDIIILTCIISVLFIVTALGPIVFQEYSIKKKSDGLTFSDFLTRFFRKKKVSQSHSQEDSKIDKKENLHEFLLNEYSIRKQTDKDLQYKEFIKDIFSENTLRLNHSEKKKFSKSLKKKINNN